MIDLRESDTYLGLLEDRIQQSRRIIVLQGEAKFGGIKEGVQAKLEAITDVQHLERILVRLLKATDWDDLLATP